MTRSQRLLIPGLALLLFILFSYVHQARFASPTPVSRLDALHALFNTGGFCIDPYQANTPDKAKFDGRFYSDKAPGTTALALPAFGLAVWLLDRFGVPLDSKRGWLVSSWLACVGSIGLITALGGAALFAWLSRRVAPTAALLTTLGVFLGSMPLPYATLMFSHASVVGWVAIALWALDHPVASITETTPGWLTPRRDAALAGFACGWAVASEFTAGLVVIGIAIAFVLLPTSAVNPQGDHPAVPSPGRPDFLMRRLLAFGLASLPPLLLIPAYSYACFGNPWVLPYSFQASFPQMQEGLYAIKWPDLHTAWRLLFDPAKGLLFWSPFLILAAFGYRRLLHEAPRLFWLTYLVPILQWAVISGRVWDWQAGPTLGPRYLAPMLPLLALPVAMGLERLPRAGFALITYAILITGIATLTDACPNYGTHQPLTDLHLPLLVQGNLSPNLGRLAGLPPHLSTLFFFGLSATGFWWLRKQVEQLPGQADPCS